MGLQTSCGVAVNIVYPNIRHVPSYIKTESFEGTFKHFHHIVCVFPKEQQHDWLPARAQPGAAHRIQIQLGRGASEGGVFID